MLSATVSAIAAVIGNGEQLTWKWSEDPPYLAFKNARLPGERWIDWPHFSKEIFLPDILVDFDALNLRVDSR